MPRKTRSETNPLYALAVLATIGLCSLVGGPAGATALANESPALFIAILFSGGVVAAILFALFLIIVINWRSGKHKAEQFRLEQENSANLLYRQVVDLSPMEFERAMCKLFEMNGFTVQHSGQTGDGGVDMRMQRGGLKYIGQCKRYQKNPVTVEQVRDFYGTLAHTGADHGYFITTSRFTKPAAEFARHKPLTLVDGPMLKKQISDQAAKPPRLES